MTYEGYRPSGKKYYERTRTNPILPHLHSLKSINETKAKQSVMAPSVDPNIGKGGIGGNRKNASSCGLALNFSPE